MINTFLRPLKAMNLKRMPTFLSTEYERNSWIVRILLGGSIEIMLLNALASFIQQHSFRQLDGTLNITQLFTSSSLPQFIVLLIMLFLSPFLTSLALTKRTPELKIVPPFYVSLIGCAWLFAVWVFPFRYDSILISLFGVFLIFLGYVEDNFVTSTLGLATERENIYLEHLKVFADIEQVKMRLTISAIEENLALSERVEGDSEQGYIFHTQSGFDFVNKISLVRDAKSSCQTDLRIVFYEKGRYNLRFSESFLEHSRKTRAYIKDILSNRAPPMKFETVTAFTNNICDPLVDSVVDELQGYYMRYKRVPKVDAIRILAFLGILGLTVILFVLEQPAYGSLTAAIDFLIAVSELPDVWRRRK